MLSVITPFFINIMKKLSSILASLPLVALLACSCSTQVDGLEYALQQAGENRTELEKVLQHYADDPQKLQAAEYLITYMPWHHSMYNPGLKYYYRLAGKVLSSGLPPQVQADSLRDYCDSHLMNAMDETVSDVKIVRSDYLIYSIDKAFEAWKDRPWNSQVTFTDFLEWLLPYKAVENQELDSWRDTLPLYFSDGINAWIPDDQEYNTTYKGIDIVRNELIDKIHMYGIYDRTGIPLLSASLLPHQTFGRCSDYVTLAVLTYRSLGLPVVIDEAPYWGRFRAGHMWYTVLGDRCQELPAEWDLGSVPGWGFFAYERIPKVYRTTYRTDCRTLDYLEKSLYKYPFNPCRMDVTDKYTRTADPEIELNEGFSLIEDYVYIAVFAGKSNDWEVVDWGVPSGNRARFHNIGLNVLYCVLAYDPATGLVPVSNPFILHQDGSVGYVIPDMDNLISVDVRRKYYQSENVVNMRRRLLGGRIEGSMSPDFSNAVTLLTIDDVNQPDLYPIGSGKDFRYYRYHGADGSYGSISQLEFYTSDTVPVTGRIIGCRGVEPDVLAKAFDGDRLTNFESEQPDGAWVGMDMAGCSPVRLVRIVPRSDDNDVCPGDTYEFRFWNGHGWESTGNFEAESNVLHFDDIPAGTLMWLRDKTRGWDERPFMVDPDGKIVWL